MIKTYIIHKMVETALEMVEKQLSKNFNFDPDKNIKIGDHYHYIAMEFQDTQSRLVYCGDIEIVASPINNIAKLHLREGSQSIIAIEDPKQFHVQRIESGTFNLYTDLITEIQ